MDKVAGNNPEAAVSESSADNVHEKFRGPYAHYYENLAQSFLKGRTSLGLPSNIMAQRLDMPKERYSRIEHRKLTASIDSIIGLMEATGMTPNEIFMYEDNSKGHESQANELASILTALPKDAFDLVSNVILYIVKSLKSPRIPVSENLTVAEVFKILEDASPKE